MAKACGLRIGPRRFELVVLDGSPKKPKLVTSLAGEIPPDELDPIGAAAHALKSAIKAHHIGMDNVGVVIDSRSAAFRNVALPVDEPAKIEAVLKFEVESQLPQFSIDEVVIDYQVLDTVADSSSLLVTAVMKSDIQASIDLCLQAGFEPLEVELETTALVNAAEAAGLCAAEEAHVLVHVGEESSAVAVIDGGRLREMRIIQTGALSHTPHGVPPSAEEDGDEDADEGGEGPDLGEGLPTIEKAADIVDRLRRELARTVSAARTLNEIGGVHVCGFLLPGMVGEAILGVPVEAMDSHEIDSTEGDVHSEYGTVAVAYGAALRQMGGGIVSASLRREELKFSGTMERLELPLAVLCLLVTTFLGVRFMFLEKEYQAIQNNLRFLLDSSVNYMISDPKKGRPGSLEYPSPLLAKYVKATTGKVAGTDPPEFKVDLSRDRFDQLVYIRGLLRSEQTDLQKQLGNDATLLQPQSALKGLTLVLDHLAQADSAYGRVSFRSLGSTYRTTTKSGDFVTVTLQLSFFAESSGEATANYERLFADLKAQPWYIDHKSPRSDPIEGAESGILLPNFKIDVDVSKAREINS